MSGKLHALYDFMVENESYNKELQAKEYKKILCQHESVQDKVVSLLYNIVNTQSQPKIDLLAEFFRHIVLDDYDDLGSFSGFAGVLGCSGNARYEGVYENLRNKKGWGDKTAALFTKVIYNLHCGSCARELAIWSDAPKTLEKDKIYLPVDAVIVDVFKRLEFSNPSFGSINNELQSVFSPSEMANWDDLWFWGFINQKGSGENRTLEWNPNKYWALESSDKAPVVIDEIESKSVRFRQLLA